MKMSDAEKFNVDSDLQSIADAMTVSGINFCGGVFDHLETGEEFELTIAKKSSVRSMVEEIAELRKSLSAMTGFVEHQMNPMVNDPSMFDDDDFADLKQAKSLLAKLNQEGEE